MICNLTHSFCLNLPGYAANYISHIWTFGSYFHHSHQTYSDEIVLGNSAHQLQAIFYTITVYNVNSYNHLRTSIFLSAANLHTQIIREKRQTNIWTTDHGKISSKSGWPSGLRSGYSLHNMQMYVTLYFLSKILYKETRNELQVWSFKAMSTLRINQILLARCWVLLQWQQACMYRNISAYLCLSPLTQRRVVLDTLDESLQMLTNNAIVIGCIQN